MDTNAFTAPFQLTKTLRRGIYDTIDPKNPELSAAGKTVLITGATGGIGGEVARAWAKAGAKGIALISRNEALLEEPSQAIKSINPSIKVLALSVDIAATSSVASAFKEIIGALGTIDVVVHAAGSMAGGPVGDIEPDAWFRDFEVNVKGSYVLVHEYLKVVSSGTFIFLGTLGVSLTMPGMSPYAVSKLAALKLAEFLDAEKPDLRVFTVHPGIVGVTETGRGMAVDALAPFALDKGIQTGGLSLYLAQSKANYLRGSWY